MRTVCRDNTPRTCLGNMPDGHRLILKQDKFIKVGLPVQVRQYSRVISSIRATFLGVLACASFCGGAEPPAIIAPASHDTSILQLDPATLVSVFMDGDTTGVSHQVSRDNARNWQPAA